MRSIRQLFQPVALVLMLLPFLPAQAATIPNLIGSAAPTSLRFQPASRAVAATGAFTRTGTAQGGRSSELVTGVLSRCYYHTATLLLSGGVGARSASSRLLTPIRPENMVQTDVQDATHTFAGTATVAEHVAFATTGSLKQPRSYHTATLLPDGRVLIAGGGRSGTFLASAELYDPATHVFSFTGSMTTPRGEHTATLLSDGKVLIVGGSSENQLRRTAELYDPTTGRFTTTASMTTGRAEHTATRLPDGRVLLAGGITNESWGKSAELYHPATHTFSGTGTLERRRGYHTATLLPNGSVLIAGGYNRDDGATASAELYLPATGTFTPTAALLQARYQHTATLLPDGKVLIAGGFNGDGLVASAEIYDPATGSFSPAGDLRQSRIHHTATLLPTGTVLIAAGSHHDSGEDDLASTELFNPAGSAFTTTGSLRVERFWHSATLLTEGKVLVVGGSNNSLEPRASAELGSHTPANDFQATLRLSADWITAPTAAVTITATTTGADVEAAALSDDGRTEGAWLPFTPGEPLTTTWDLPREGTSPLFVRLRDTNGQVATVVSGTINVDRTPPQSSLGRLADQSPASFELAWSGGDTLSGVASFDVETRAGTAGEWQPLVTATTAMTTTFTGMPDVTYYFRVRARDHAGNVEPWPTDFDAVTHIDATPPTGTLAINGEAHTTTTPTVDLHLAASDELSAVTHVRVRTTGEFGPWQPFAPRLRSTLSGDVGLQTVVVQFRDAVGNISQEVSDTIRLDPTGVDPTLSINGAALWTNVPTVTLVIGAPVGTTEMQLSNDGGFAGAVWQPFDTRPAWTITTFGAYTLPRSVYVRTRDSEGRVTIQPSDDIIYDPLPPTGTVSITSVSSSSVRVAVNADDSVSGVARMRLSTDPTFGGASWRAYAATSTVPRNGSGTRVYAQFEDRAGNRSAIGCAAQDGEPCVDPGDVRVFLPLVRR